MKKYQSFLCGNFQFLEVKFSVYLNRCFHNGGLHIEYIDWLIVLGVILCPHLEKGKKVIEEIVFSSREKEKRDRIDTRRDEWQG